MHNHVQNIKICTTATTLKKSDSNERLNDAGKNKKTSFHKSNSCDHIMRKSTSLDNFKATSSKMKQVRSASSLYSCNEPLSNKDALNDDDLQGFRMDECGEFLDDLYTVVDDTYDDNDTNHTDRQGENNELNIPDDLNKSMDMIKHIAATNCTGIIYDCIQKKDEIIQSPASIIHIVQDHVTSHAIHSLTDHIFHL